MATTPQEMADALSSLMAGWNTRGQWAMLRLIRQWVRQWQGPDADAGDIESQIAEQWDEQFGNETDNSEDENNPLHGLFDQAALEEGARAFRQEKIEFYVKLSRTLGNLPTEVTESVFDCWEGKLATGTQAEDALQALEEQVRASLKTLDDRTRFVVTALGRLQCLDGFSAVHYFMDILNEFRSDVDFLEVKSAEFASDPQLGTLVRTIKLAQTLYAIEDNE